MQEKFTTSNFWKAKAAGRKITMLTAYDYPTAKRLDDAGIDSILVGDSLGMVVLGYEDTTKVTMEDMIHHIKAVTRGAKRAMVVGDLPFLSYHLGVYEAVRNAGRIMSEGGAGSVKLEGGVAVEDTIQHIVSAGIPVMGHIGYTPQSYHVFGGHKAQGKTLQTAQRVVDDAFAVQRAGAYAVVLECVPWKLAAWITERLDIPTIGIGAGPACDGQVLVTPDMLGMYPEFPRKHNKVFEDSAALFSRAFETYQNEVRAGVFPATGNSFTVEDEIIAQLKGPEKC